MRKLDSRGEKQKYYMHKGHFIFGKAPPRGMYYAHSEVGTLKADTLCEMKRLINDLEKTRGARNNGKA